METSKLGYHLITQCFNGTAQPERIGRVVFGYRQLSSLRRSKNEI